MKKILTMLMFTSSAFISNAQVDFENLIVDTSLYWKGNPGVPGLTTFTSGLASFLNRNDTSSFGDYWSGWAYSAKQDTTSISYANNDISCIAGKGHNNSSKYGVAYYNSYDSSINRIKFNPISGTFGQVIKGVYLNNTTIAYRSMQNGDFIAKKFGGTSGNDSDYFRIKFVGWRNGVPKSDTVSFYLADFRDTNNANDYIIKDWSFVDMMALGIVDSVNFWMESSDVGLGGINTPTYFCMDDMDMLIIGGVNDPVENKSIGLYPNPVIDKATMINHGEGNYVWHLFSINGNLLQEGVLKPKESVNLNMLAYPKGNYYIRLLDDKGISYKKMLK